MVRTRKTFFELIEIAFVVVLSTWYSLFAFKYTSELIILIFKVKVDFWGVQEGGGGRRGEIDIETSAMIRGHSSECSVENPMRDIDASNAILVKRDKGDKIKPIAKTEMARSVF